MNVAVIPARGGSKRVPRKNIRDFCGEPLIARSILAAKNSELFDMIVVSTDDEEIAEIARRYGVDVPFTRPNALSDDHTCTLDVVKHALQWLLDHGQKVEYVCCIYATAPFLLPRYLKQGWHELTRYQCSYAFSVTSFAFPIQRAIHITQEQRVEMFQPEHFMTRSQDLQEAYHDAGQFYWGTTQAWLDQRPLFSNHSVPVILPRHRVQDIDTQEDWLRAEWLFKALQAVED